MNVKLVSYSMVNPDYSEELDPDTNLLDLVAYCARVSNPANQFNKETASRLVNYLREHKHWSPFEMVHICLEINTTRDIARQILRHRSFSFQEFSQRYADVNALGDMFEFREARLQDAKNRQNSIEHEDTDLDAWWDDVQHDMSLAVEMIYQEALDRGIAKEQARVVLPEGMTKSRMFMGGTLRSWIHYIDLRSANGTQKEHMEIAKACAEAISKIYPI